MGIGAAAAAASVCLVFVLWLIIRIGGSTGVLDFDDVVTALAAMTACLACLSAARQHGAARRFWLLLAMALGAWTLAEVIWAVYDLVLHVAVPVPSWADVGYLGAIPLAAAALLCHPGMRAAGSRRTLATLDGLAIGTALLLLSWTFVLGPLWRHTHLSTAGGIVAIAYPFGDLVIIFLIVLSVCAMTAAGRAPLLWVLLGLFAMAISDSTYAYLVEVGRYTTGNLVDVGWVVGYLAIAVGAANEAGDAVAILPDQVGEPSLLSLVTPYVPVLLALLVMTFEMEINHRVDRFSWLTGFGLALLAIARQGLVVLGRDGQTTSPCEQADAPAPTYPGAAFEHERVVAVSRSELTNEPAP